jgi:hypothetical protein
MVDQINGAVAKLITDDELVINRGSDQGVAKNMRFWILDPRTEDIVDPETGEHLGGVPRSKVIVEAVTVGPKVTLARRVPPPTFGATGLSGSIGSVLASIPAETTRKEEPIGIIERWPEGVMVGDPVRSITVRPPRRRVS